MIERFWWPTSRRRGIVLGIILLVGLCLRLWLWWRTPVHQPANDEVEYLAVARDLLAGRGWRFYDTYTWLRAPLYPLWLAGSMWAVAEDLRRAPLPNVALSTLTIYQFYLLGRQVGRAGNREQPYRAEQIGLIAAGASAVLWTLATFASLWMAETLFTFVFMGALLALLRGVDPNTRRPLVWLGAAGVLLALAILTRSLPLTLLPCAALWIVFARPCAAGSHWRERFRRALPGALLFVATTVATIAPWTIRNYAAYGAFIPVETGLSYNLWWFNDPHEDEDTIFRELTAIPNPAERADYATAKGLARLREDPTILVRNLWPNFNALWMVKPIEDRFLLSNYYQDVPFGVFAGSIVFDDALYTAAALLGLLGLAVAPLDRRKWLLGGWLLYVQVVVLLTHGEGRYRHFVFPVLLPYAAWALVMLPGLLRRSRRRALAVAATLAALVALMWTPLVLRYPATWAWTNLHRGWLMQRADWAARAGDDERALAFYRAANQADPRSPDVWLAIGVLELRRGNVADAASAFDSAFLISPSYIPVNVRRGDALRRLGRDADAARAFEGFYTDEIAMLDWAFDELGAPLPATIEVGDGLDFGYVGGMYAAEEQLGRQARWTKGRAALRFAGSSTGATLELTLAAPRPDGTPVPAQVCVDDTCRNLALGAAWRTIALVVPAAERYDVVITAPVFEPRAANPASADDRHLGVLVDRGAVDELDELSTNPRAVQDSRSRMEARARP